LERTFVMLKPDAVRRGLVGKIIARFEDKGLKIEGMRMQEISRSLGQQHYDVHRDKPFYGELVDFVTSGPVVVMKLAGENAIEVVRKLMGGTHPKDADPGTIRGDWGLVILENLVHGSDGPETAAGELKLFFG